MSWQKVVFIALVAASLWQFGRRWQLRPIHPADGATAPAEPLQTDMDAVPSVVHGRWKLTARARYEITARILSREDYRFDALSDLIPEDLALGWGPMSDNRVLGRVRDHTVRAILFLAAGKGITHSPSRRD